MNQYLQGQISIWHTKWNNKSYFFFFLSIFNQDENISNIQTRKKW